MVDVRKRDATPGKPQNAVALTRLSDLRDEDLNEQGQAKGLVDQNDRVKERGEQLGWKIGQVIVENDLVRRENGSIKGVSAFKRRKVTLPDGRKEWRTFRPGLRKAMDMLATGEADGFLCLDSDRVFRDPRDLEDMIDLVAERGFAVESVTGSLKLDNDANITMARVMVAMANKASRDTGRRVSAARERQARAGEYGGGRRPFGFDEDGETVRPDEAAIILDCSVRVVQAAEADEESEKSASLRSLAAELRTKNVPTVTGTDWSAETLRDILLRPRNAGIMVHKGEELCDAPWDALVPLETFRAVQRILTDPNRRTGPGAAPKWLGTTLFKCGICTDEQFTKPVGMQVAIGGRDPRYTCKDFGHLSRNVAHTNTFVVTTILNRLGREDAVDLLTPAKPEIDVTALREESAVIRANLNEQAADQVLGRISKAQLHAASAAGQARLDAIESELNSAVVDSPLKPLIGAANIVAAWEALSLSHKRLVIDTLVTVRILPIARRGRGFDPATIDIRFKEHRKAEAAPDPERATSTSAKPKARKKAKSAA